MRITRIDFEGESGRYATVQRRTAGGQGPDIVEITILSPEEPNGRVRRVNADSTEEIFNAALDLQRELDGYVGSNSDVQEYHLDLLRLSNC